MRTFILMLMLTFIGIITNAQTTKPAKPYKPNVEVTKEGNFKAVATTTTSSATKTEKTFTDSKGVVYPVWITKNGKHFVVKTSKKTGNEYRYYLKLPNE